MIAIANALLHTVTIVIHYVAIQYMNKVSSTASRLDTKIGFDEGHDEGFTEARLGEDW